MAWIKPTPPSSKKPRRPLRPELIPDDEPPTDSNLHIPESDEDWAPIDKKIGADLGGHVSLNRKRIEEKDGRVSVSYSFTMAGRLLWVARSIGNLPIHPKTFKDSVLTAVATALSIFTMLKVAIMYMNGAATVAEPSTLVPATVSVSIIAVMAALGRFVRKP